MSTLSKVFVVLVLVFSLLWLGAAATLFALRIDYKDKLEKEIGIHQKDVAELKGRIAVLEQDVASKNSEISGVRNELAEAKVALEGAQQDLKDWKQKHTDLMNEYAKISESLKHLEDAMAEKDKLTAQLQEEVNEYKKKYDEAVEDRYTFQEKYNAVKDQLDKLKKESTSLEKQYVQTLKDLDEARRVLEEMDRRGIDTPEVGGIARDVEGVVQAKSTKGNLVIISVGKDDGVSPRSRMMVSRRGRYIGEIQIDKVERNWSSAHWIQELLQDEIQVGDRVQTKTYGNR